MRFRNVLRVNLLQNGVGAGELAECAEPNTERRAEHTGAKHADDRDAPSRWEPDRDGLSSMGLRDVSVAYAIPERHAVEDLERTGATLRIGKDPGEHGIGIERPRQRGCRAVHELRLHRFDRIHAELA